MKKILIALFLSVVLSENVYANDNKLSYLCNEFSGKFVFLDTVNINTKIVTREIAVTRPFLFDIQTHEVTVSKNEISYNAVRTTKTIINRKTLEMYLKDEMNNAKNLIKANCELQKDYTTGKKRFEKTAYILESMNSSLMNSPSNNKN